MAEGLNEDFSTFKLLGKTEKGFLSVYFSLLFISYYLLSERNLEIMQKLSLKITCCIVS